MKTKWRGAAILVATVAAALALTMGAGASPLFEEPGAPAEPLMSMPALDPSLRTGKPTVMQFAREGCPGCAEMAVVLGRLREAHGDRYTVVEVDLLAQRDIGQRHHVQLTPTQVFFDAQGCETARHVGKLELVEVIARLDRAYCARP